MYIWIKAFHIIFVIALMAGLLVFPRYKLHQIKSVPGEPLFETMKEASARLRRIILSPSLVIVWVLGLLMLYLNQGLFLTVWIYPKLALVLGLSALHGYLIGVGRKIDRGEKPVSERTLKLLNEVPFLIAIAVVILAVVKPF